VEPHLSFSDGGVEPCRGQARLPVFLGHEGELGKGAQLGALLDVPVRGQSELFPKIITRNSERAGWGS
jgi:hypothetical protein